VQVSGFNFPLENLRNCFSVGEERTEPLHSLIFKYVLSPSVNRQALDNLAMLASDSQAVDTRRARVPRRWHLEGSSEREDTLVDRGRPRRWETNSPYSVPHCAGVGPGNRNNHFIPATSA
jgi:hypothetical protein